MEKEKGIVKLQKGYARMVLTVYLIVFECFRVKER